MKSNYSSVAKDGDVIRVTYSNGMLVGYVKIEDKGATGNCQINGHDCRQATESEVSQAYKDRTIRHEVWDD